MMLKSPSKILDMNKSALAFVLSSGADTKRGILARIAAVFNDSSQSSIRAPYLYMIGKRPVQ